MLQKNSKGQAAMEFLMTYGWAIMVILAAIGLLAYFVVFKIPCDTFNTDKYDECVNQRAEESAMMFCSSEELSDLIQVRIESLTSSSAEVFSYGFESFEVEENAKSGERYLWSVTCSADVAICPQCQDADCGCNRLISKHRFDYAELYELGYIGDVK